MKRFLRVALARSEGTLAAALATALAVIAMPVCADQGPFGKPVVQPAPGQATVAVMETTAQPTKPIAVKVPDAVSRTQNALAEVTARNAVGAQVVTLPYGEHSTYEIPIRSGLFSTMKFPDTILKAAFMPPLAVEPDVDQGSNTITVRLVQPITVVGTIITKDRIFYVSLTPAGPADPWYQGVSWSTKQATKGAGNGGIFEDGVYVNSSAGAPGVGGVAQPGGAQDPGDDLFTGQPNFDYDVSGDAAFKPVAIYDNGRFTWVQFPKKLQELPALFVEGPNGLEIVNYTVHNDSTQLLVNRLMPAFVLKIGKTELHVKAHR